MYKPINLIFGRSWRVAALPAALLIALTACSGESIAPGATPPPPTPTPQIGINDQLRAAFGLADRPARLKTVLTLIPSFLDDLALRHTDDPSASQLLTDIAFSSGQMVFTDPAFIRRYQTLAIFGLPDAMGLYLVNMSGKPSGPPREISRWTAGLNSVDLAPQNSEAGLSFTTVGVDRLARVHYALLNQAAAGWQVSWLSDEVPEWWFNATSASLSVSPDLSQLTVTGEALGTTSVFIESNSTPRRRFRVGWLRDRAGYSQFPAMGGSSNRQNWLWQIAEPSPYATLVEFIERLRARDVKGAGALVTDTSVVSAAQSFGLYLADNTYVVSSADDQRIAFQGRQGAFVATFQPPPAGSPPEARWLMTAIEPAGAASPTPTP